MRKRETNVTIKGLKQLVASLDRVIASMDASPLRRNLAVGLIVIAIVIPVVVVVPAILRVGPGSAVAGGLWPNSSSIISSSLSDLRIVQLINLIFRRASTTHRIPHPEQASLETTTAVVTTGPQLSHEPTELPFIPNGTSSPDGSPTVHCYIAD